MSADSLVGGFSIGIVFVVHKFPSRVPTFRGPPNGLLAHVVLQVVKVPHSSHWFPKRSTWVFDKVPHNVLLVNLAFRVPSS